MRFLSVGLQVERNTQPTLHSVYAVARDKKHVNSYCTVILNTNTKGLELSLVTVVGFLEVTGNVPYPLIHFVSQFG
jgi:hypothetical protein